jgi:hypothetical protein
MDAKGFAKTALTFALIGVVVVFGTRLVERLGRKV